MAEDDAALNPEQDDAKQHEARAGHKQSYWQRFRRLKIDNQIIAISNVILAATTGVYVVVSILTWITISTNSDTSSKQTKKLIDAANIQACAASRSAAAAEQFSRAADEINANTKIAVQDFAILAKSSEKSIKASQDSAQRALDVSIAASRLDERPWVVGNVFQLSNEPENGKMGDVTISVMNTGKTPALDLIPISKPYIWPITMLLPELDISEVTKAKSIGVLAPGHVGTGFTSDTLPDKQAALDAYNSGLNYYYVRARIDYSDVNGAKHWTTLCVYHIKGRPLTEFNYCPDGNDVDRNQATAKKD
jgi:hypothetical protein